MNVQLRDPSALTQNVPVSPASYWMPDLVTDSAWIEHAPFGFWMMAALRPRTIVELGVHRGFSYFVLCQAVARLHLPARCFAIDTFRGDEHAGFYGEEIYDAVLKHNRRYDSFSRLIRSDFTDACQEFANSSIDLLHIDGCHSFEAVRRDFELWLPKMSARGVVMLHDTAEYGNGFGVYRLWEMLRARYPHFEFMHGHGLGVVGVGDSAPVQVRELFDASACPASSQMIRAHYERLGGFISNSQRTALLMQHVEDLEARIASYEASTSWRLTAPLRIISRLVRSARGVAEVAGNVGAVMRDATMVSGEAALPRYRPQPRSWTLP